MKKRSLHNLTLFVFLLGTLLLAAAPATGKTKRGFLAMYLGQVRVLNIGEIERVAIGNPKIMSSSILDTGQLVVMANAGGATTVHLWLKNGDEMVYEVDVFDKNKIDNYDKIRSLMKDVPGVTVRKISGQTVLQGYVAVRDKEVFDRITKRYPEVLNLVTPADSFHEISDLLADIPNLKLRKMGRSTVVSGEVSEDHAKLINLVASRYSSLLNLTQQKSVVAEKMIYMQVKIMEMTRTFTENIGINWKTIGISGPSFEFGFEVPRNGATILNSGVSGSLASAGLADLTTGTGFFGVATKINSIINLAERTGDAVTLAQPRLSARSGGKAEFLAGGEYPMPTTSAQGQVSVEFKKYGIILKIEPIVDENNNIMAHVETEVSEIDSSVSVSGIPGIKTRSTQTDVSMLPHQTLVIAGLLKEEGSSNNEDVAWLRDVPILGPLFRSNSFKNNLTELVIFVTPTIHDVNSEENRNALEKATKIRSAFTKIVAGDEILD